MTKLKIGIYEIISNRFQVKILQIGFFVQLQTARLESRFIDPEDNNGGHKGMGAPVIAGVMQRQSLKRPNMVSFL
jgi:hypothetical protein